MKLYQSIELAIDGLDVKGRGTVTREGKKIAVPSAFPGDVVEAQLKVREKGIVVAELIRIIKPSPHRVPPHCDHASASGGCFWQVIDYGTQLQWKRRLVQEIFDRQAVPVSVPEALPSPRLFEFRNKMEFAVGPGPAIGTKRLGKWWEIVDMDGCLLLSKESGEVIRRIREYMKEEGVSGWDNRAHRGFMRYVVIREGKFTGERMVVLVTAEGALPATGKLVGALQPYLSSLYHGVNARVSDIAAAGSYELIWGREFLEERIGERSYLIHPLSFFQTNSYATGLLIDTVTSFLDARAEERILDLYCGLGLFSIVLAQRCAHVIGVEAERQAVELAELNSGRNGIHNVEFQCRKAEELTWVGAAVDAALVDPPRAGLHPRVVDALVQFGPARLVYVCCNPAAFAREHVRLQEAYAITRVAALDLFPHSPHAELVIKLERWG